MKVLLVEDDVAIADAIQTRFQQDMLHVEHVNSGSQALHAVKLQEFAVIILDLGLPDMSGFQILSEVRSQKIDTPVLILTARDASYDKVHGLDLGADDYVVKPFDLEEMLARVRALIRRSMGRSAPALVYGDIRIEPASKTIFYKNSLINLPVTQYKLLQYLIECKGHVKTKQQIIDALYRWEDCIEENTIEVYVSQIRKRIDSSLIKTIRGIGYMVSRAPE
ncbi:DNA-binding response regulator [Bacterioplanes sanyensis]|uniref:DNA-binding response regulator n=1 Tax=Bacterioplanes sanyensis TaxID=1249553 RepID=A0A222FHW6_9GAMM|nr:response regulator transcription factor [Bacterioplanes sanyensis]ASP38242.1 DNA-binding response regulator [Bacterioplanes sanyensis]